MNDDDRIAPDGAIWVCAVCGRTAKDRYRMGDTSCVLHAVLCHDPPPAGRWVAVKPSKPGEPNG